MPLAARTVLIVTNQAAVAALTCHLLGDEGGGLPKHKYIIQLCHVWLYVKKRVIRLGFVKECAK